MTGWRLAAGSTWLDDRTLAGGTPYAVLKLSPTGATVVRRLLCDSAADPAEATSERDLITRLSGRGILVPPPAKVATSVTVVVPARSLARPVQRVLDSLPPDLPVVVVDDGSPRALTGLRHDALRVIRHETSRGPGAARNAGARLATTDWVLFCDADIEAAPGWVDALLSYAAGAAAVAPRVRAAGGRGAGAWFESAAPALDLGTKPAVVGPGRPVSYVPSAALLVRRSALLSVGGFDESLRVGEDVDLVWRLPGPVRFRPEVVVEHTPRPSLLAALHRRALYGRSAGALARRHPRTLHHVEVSVWSLLPWLLAMSGRPRSAVLLAGGLSWSAPRALPRLDPAHARRLAAEGQVRAVTGLGRWLVRPMLPLTMAAALVFPATRGRLVLAVLPALAERAVRSHRGAAPVGSTAASLLDDAAYSVGVWVGAVEHRRAAPLLPRVRFGRRG